MNTAASTPDGSGWYEIRLPGRLDARWSARFEGMDLTTGDTSRAARASTCGSSAAANTGPTSSTRSSPTAASRHSRRSRSTAGSRHPTGSRHSRAAGGATAGRLTGAPHRPNGATTCSRCTARAATACTARRR